MDIKKAYLEKVLSKYLFDKDGKYKVKWINFEFNSSCNLRCKWCTLDHTKKREIISEETLTKSFDEFIANGKFSIKRIDLHNAGETLLHPNLKRLLDIIAVKKQEIKSKPTVHLLTNALILNEQKSREIIESGAIDEIRFSIDGGTKEAYESIRRGSNWGKVRDNIKKFLELNNGKIKTGVICIVPNERDISIEWMEDDFKEIFLTMDNIDLRRPHNWDGSIELDIDETANEQANGRTCKFLMKNMVILPNGDVTVCCADLNGRGIIGNVNDSSLEEIFLSFQRLQMLKLFSKGKKDDINLCKACAGFYE
ncbi:MAG: Radical SAM domain protein [Candidatus Wolfebacteria bacterium GW2011_GWC2_39_22]|uniref:Radical SAM domain protein n=1 Tax=Candidatus Wolfebacteria bacterium GW2011_GWC2_39_22 TaxID=1619013 RepID=A0A0G0NGU2_9BACT|nr:MAG: Radical SAM domain protein [Candidatus Wolfebacteria bacterium GW2011_GWC2_39_22]